MLVFVIQKSLRRPIDEMGRAARRALQQDIAVACRIRILLDPVLHVLMNDRTAKHDAGRCSSICRAPALLVTQINVEQLIFGWLQRAFDPAAHNRRFQRIDPVAAAAVILNFPRRGGSSLHRLSAAAVFIVMMVMYGFAQMGSGSPSYRGRDVDELLGLARYYNGNGNRVLAIERPGRAKQCFARWWREQRFQRRLELTDQWRQMKQAPLV